jgi:hypothetical protein
LDPSGQNVLPAAVDKAVILVKAEALIRYTRLIAHKNNNLVGAVSNLSGIVNIKEGELKSITDQLKQITTNLKRTRTKAEEEEKKAYQASYEQKLAQRRATELVHKLSTAETSIFVPQEQIHDLEATITDLTVSRKAALKASTRSRTAYTTLYHTVCESILQTDIDPHVHTCHICRQLRNCFCPSPLNLSDTFICPNSCESPRLAFDLCAVCDKSYPTIYPYALWQKKETCATGA